MDGKSETFYGNVATLPLNDASVFIRPYAMRQYSPPDPLCGIVKFLAAAQAAVSELITTRCVARSEFPVLNSQSASD